MEVYQAKQSISINLPPFKLTLNTLLKKNLVYDEIDSYIMIIPLFHISVVKLKQKIILITILFIPLSSDYPVICFW